MQYGNGEWKYLTNEAGLKKFWIDGIERNKNYESIVTVGMRGDKGDMAMPDAGGFDADKRLLEKIVTDQRQIILAEHMNPDVTKIPQAGISSQSQSITTGNNVGNLRRLPTPDERNELWRGHLFPHGR